MSRLARTTSPARLHLVSDVECGAVIANAATGESLTTNVPTTENSVLFKAYDRLVQAKAEVTAAQDALEWLADEWRHLWPLAPEELLHFAGATDRSANAERDIMGRCIIRDTAALTKRFSRKMRQERPRECFTVTRSDDALDSLECWRRSKRCGKTEAGSLRLAKERENAISKFEEQYRLALKYEAQTAHIRRASGVEQAIKRVARAKKHEAAATRAVFSIKARTAEDLRIKAASLDEEMMRVITSPLFTGSFGDIGRFIVEAMDILGREAA